MLRPSTWAFLSGLLYLHNLSPVVLKNIKLSWFHYMFWFWCCQKIERQTFCMSFQRRIQNPAKHLRWRVLRKYLTQKAPSLILDRVLNTSLQIAIARNFYEDLRDSVMPWKCAKKKMELGMFVTAKMLYVTYLGTSQTSMMELFAEILNNF